MSRINLDDNRTWGLRLGPRTVFESEQGVQVTADVIGADSPPVIMLQPAGAINMRLAARRTRRRRALPVRVRSSSS